MQNISLYLEKFQSVGLKEKQCKQLVVDVVQDVCGAKISQGEVSYKDGEVVINATGPLKASVFLNKQKIFTELQQRLDDPKEVSSLF